MKAFSLNRACLLAIMFVAANFAFAVCPGARHETSLAGYALSPDGTRIAAVGDDGTFFWWDTSSGKRTNLADCIRARDFDHPVLFSPDSTQVAVAVEQAVEVFDLLSGKLSARLTAPDPKEIYKITFSGNGQRLAASYQTGAAVWDLNSRQVVAAIEARPEPKALSLNKDGTTLLLGSGDGVELWTLDVNGSMRKLVEKIPAESVLFAHDDQWIVALTAAALPRKPTDRFLKFQREIGVWDRLSGKRLRTLQTNGPLEDLHFGLASGGPDLVLASDYKQHLYSWDLETGALKSTWKTPAGHPSSDGRLLLRPSGFPGELQLWEIGAPDSDARSFAYKSPICAPSLRDANGNVRFDMLAIYDGISTDDGPMGSYSGRSYVAQDCTAVGVSRLTYKTRERAIQELQREIGQALESLDVHPEGRFDDLVPEQRFVLRVRGLTPGVGGFSILHLNGTSLIEIFSISLPAALAMESEQWHGK